MDKKLIEKVRRLSAKLEYSNIGNINKKLLNEILVIFRGQKDELSQIISALATKELIEINDNSDLDLDNYFLSNWTNFSPKIRKEITLSGTQKLILAKLLYDREEYHKAIDIFDVLLANTQLTENQRHETIFLSAYSLEYLGRTKLDNSFIQKAIRYVESLVEHKEKRVMSEAYHALGHLHLANYSIDETYDPSIGINFLRKASECNKCYLSCYTSSFSEMGNFIKAIEESKNEFHKSSYLTVDMNLHFAQIVKMEMLFYLAYAYSRIGEYTKAIDCFNVFKNVMFKDGKFEAADHADFFILKTKMKQSLFNTLSMIQIEKFIRVLNGVSFKSRTSSTVKLEVDRYKIILEFFKSMIEYKLEKIPLKSVVDSSKYISSNLKMKNEIIFTVIYDDESQLDRLSQYSNYKKINFNEIELPLHLDCSILVILCKDYKELFQIVLREYSEKLVIVLSTDLDVVHSLRDFDVELINSEAEFDDTLSIANAYSLCKRYLIEDDYIFGLAPCLHSPALVYQKPKYNLKEFVNEL